MGKRKWKVVQRHLLEHDEEPDREDQAEATVPTHHIVPAKGERVPTLEHSTGQLVRWPRFTVFVWERGCWSAAGGTDYHAVALEMLRDRGGRYGRLLERGTPIPTDSPKGSGK